MQLLPLVAFVSCTFNLTPARAPASTLRCPTCLSCRRRLLCSTLLQVSLFPNDTAQFYAASVVLVFEHLHSHNILYVGVGVGVGV